MANDNQFFMIQCVGCSSKLRLSDSVRGKTIACPKCGQQMKIKESAAAAQPASAKPIAAQPVQAKPVAPAAPYQDNWTAGAFPAAPTAYPQSQNYSAYYATAQRKPLNPAWIWGGIAAAGGLVVIGFVVALLLTLSKSPGVATGNTTGGNAAGGNAAAAPTGAGSPLGAAAKPGAGGSSARQNFPELGMTMPVGNSAVVHRIELARPGQPILSLNIFVPKGDHAAQSLPVVFEAPAGTPLLHGARLDVSPFNADIPFTDAGMITVNFSLDGSMPGGLSPESSPQYFPLLSRAYKEFVDSDAGVNCGKVAIDYVLSKVQAADPKRLYVAGHSSAATVALLLASKDSRIAKCMAFAPATDLNLRLGELLTEPTIQKFLPNLRDYLKSGSPITYTGQLKCPVFIAHMRDDDNEPFSNTQTYVNALKQAGGNVTFFERPRGGHYQVMLEASIPKAIEWLKD